MSKKRAFSESIVALNNTTRFHPAITKSSIRPVTIGRYVHIYRSIPQSGQSTLSKAQQNTCRKANIPTCVAPQHRMNWQPERKKGQYKLQRFFGPPTEHPRWLGWRATPLTYCGFSHTHTHTLQVEL